MIKVKVIENFSLGKFKELKNIARNNSKQDLDGMLFKGDTFECTEEMAEYLTKTNAQGKAFVEVVEIIPEKKEEKVEDIEKKLTTRRKKRSVAKD